MPWWRAYAMGDKRRVIFTAMEGAERKLATMVFADLAGSTELAAGMDPEDLRARLEPFFELAREALTGHGGTIEKYIGDAVMAVFGVPKAHGDDADRAVAAGLELARRVAEGDTGLAVRIGIEAGEVLATHRGGDLAVTGEAVNAAARLQAAAQPGEVLVGERAARSTRLARLEPYDPIDAKGFPAPLQAWRALGVATRTRLAATPFIGRDDEVELLRIAYRRAVGQRVPELVTITGEAGIGKTRLANELFKEIADAEPRPRILLGRNPPYGRGIAFWALGEVLRSAAGVGAEASVGEVRTALADRLAKLGAADAAQLAEALAVPLGGGSNGAGGEGTALKRAWRRLVALLAAERPLVIGLDDAHWADDGLLDLIEEVTLGIENAPLLMLCTSRPELVERRPGFGSSAPNVTRIELRPLNDAATAELSTALLPESARELAPKVAATSGGNPFFAEEVSVRIVDDPEAAASGELPETVQGAIAARLDLLPAPEKRAIQYAAVLGSGFLAEALTELLGDPVDEVLGALVAKALIQERLAEGPGRYAFRHQLIRDVAYASLPRADRARLHGAAAAGIVARTAERYPELAELVAFHRIQAAELDPTPARRREAYLATVDAAGIVAERAAVARAQELYEHAAELAVDVEERLEAVRSAAGTAMRQFRGDQALRLRKREAEIAETEGMRDAAASAYAIAVAIPGRMGGITGEVPEGEMVAMLRRGRELVSPDDLATQTRLVLDEAWIAWRMDRMAEMEEPARKGLELARKTGDPALISNALDAISSINWHVGRFEAAHESTMQRVEILDRVKERTPEIEYEIEDAGYMATETKLQIGRLRDAADEARRQRERDLARGVTHMAWLRGLLVTFLLGEWDETLELAKRGREAWIEVRRPAVSAMSTGLAAAGAIHGYRGRYDEADKAFAFADSLMLAADFGKQSRGIAAIRADVLLHRGLAAEAAALLPQKILEFWSWWTAPQRATRAEALVLAGDARADEAIAAADELSAEHPIANATTLRAKALASGDEEPLRESLEIFKRIECPYQAARSGWLLGGDARREAERTFERLGATLPAEVRDS
jgi:class 3 adenylate cyclase